MVFSSTQYFASAAEIAGILHVGTAADSVEFSETDLDYVLPIIQGEIHDFLKAEGVISASPVGSTAQGYYTIKSVLVELLDIWNQRRQKNKLGADGGSSVGMSHLTTEQKITLLSAFLVNEERGIDIIPTYRSQFDEVP